MLTDWESSSCELLIRSSSMLAVGRTRRDEKLSGARPC